MTDKVQKIRNEVEKLKSNLMYGACSSQVVMETRCKEEAYNEVLSIMDSMQEEPKECMYSKDNYTAEDRKVLCDGCEEECIEKMNEERKRDLSLWSLGDFENKFFEIIEPYKDSRNYKNLCIRLVVWRSELWRWIHWKKRISEDLEEAATLYAKEEYSRKNPATLPDRCIGCYTPIMYAFRNGANWKEQQLMANAVDVEVKVDAGGYPYIPQIELYDYCEDIPLAKESDKYKVILIKEDKV